LMKSFFWKLFWFCMLDILSSTIYWSK